AEEYAPALVLHLEEAVEGGDVERLQGGPVHEDVVVPADLAVQDEPVLEDEDVAVGRPGPDEGRGGPDQGECGKARQDVRGHGQNSRERPPGHQPPGPRLGYLPRVRAFIVPSGGRGRQVTVEYGPGRGENTVGARGSRPRAEA